MIIECPACTTRYDIKTELPLEGRTVRCAKCGTVWRAMPEPQEAPEAAETAWAATEARKAMTGWDAGEEERRDAAEDAHGDQWAAGHESAHASHEESSENQASARVQASDIGEEQPQPEQNDDRDKDEAAGKVSWFSSFRRKKKSKDKDVSEETLAVAAPVQASGETIPFPRPHLAEEAPAAPEEDLRTLEDARQAVRNVFSSLSEGRASSRAILAASPLAAEVDREQTAESPSEPDVENAWTGAASARDDAAEGLWMSVSANVTEPNASVDRAEAEGWRGPNGRSEPPAGSERAWAPAKRDPFGDDEKSDPDAALREAMWSHFPSSEKASLPGNDLANRLETHLRSTTPDAAEPAPQKSIAGLWRKSAADIDEEVAEQPAIVEETPESKDYDAVFDPRLFREIEETQEKSGEARRGGRGGLAIAAAWGLFICVAAGLAGGFLAFRDIIADAAPGLAPLYRALGVPITLQPLVIDEVQYTWKIAENKPVLVISGIVHNKAQRKVRVPQLYITIKDQDPALDREYSANLKLDRSKIRSNERADFDIELLSPSPTVTSVELELRNIR